MGLYHTVDIAYGIEIPATLDIEDIENALSDQPSKPDAVTFIIVGDLDRLLLVTRCTLAAENTVTAITPGTLATVDEMTAWNEALAAAAARIGQAAHPQPGWLLIHNYR